MYIYLPKISISAKPGSTLSSFVKTNLTEVLRYKSVNFFSDLIKFIKVHFYFQVKKEMSKPNIIPLKLGENSYLAIGTQNISSSFFFYRKLGFAEISEGETPAPWKRISDNSILIQLNKDDREYLKLTYLTENFAEKVNELLKKGISFTDRHFNENKELTEIDFYTPESMPISVLKKDPSEVFEPLGKKLIDVGENELKNLINYSEFKCGLFGEISLPVPNLPSAIEFWAEIGFVPLNVYSDPYPWAILTDDINVIGLHQTMEFNFPAITYFAPDMATRIKRLKDSGLTSFKVFGNQNELPKNVMFTSPEGQKFLLFTL